MPLCVKATNHPKWP